MSNICNVSLQVIPLVSDKNEAYGIIDRVINYIASQGVKYEVGPMETTMEGEIGQLLNIVKAAQDICATSGAFRVISVVKIDYSPEGVTIDEKIQKYRYDK